MRCDKEMCEASLTLPDSTWPERTARNWSEAQRWRNDDEDHDYCPAHADERPTFNARNEIA
jgi:hypothetical protein